jgi:superfamily II DNA or RNA helicase
MGNLEQQLLEVKKRGSFDAFTHLCDGFEAAAFQAVSVLLWLYSKRGLFMFDPGLGKTYAIAMGIKALFGTDPGMKCIFFIKKSQITQTSNDIKWYTGLRVATCTAEQEQIATTLVKHVDSYDVLMLTHDALQSDLVCAILTEIVGAFRIAVVDEAHFLQNVRDSDRVVVLAAIVARMEYVAFLTATPFLSKAEQYSSLLSIMDPATFSRTDKLTKLIRNGHRLDELYPLQIYNYDRAALGISNTYNVHVLWVEPHDFQKNLDPSSNTYLQKARGPGAENQVAELLRIIQLQKLGGKKGIVFVYYHETREWLLPHLDAGGVRYGCIHGRTPQAEKDDVQRRFNDNLLDCVVISVTTSINLDCDYVYFYQYTLEIKQILGRGERGLNPKTMELFFLFSRGTRDAEHFLNSVYRLSAEVRAWIGKEYSEFLSVGEQLMVSPMQLFTKPILEVPQ